MSGHFYLFRTPAPLMRTLAPVSKCPPPCGSRISRPQFYFPPPSVLVRSYIHGVGVQLHKWFEFVVLVDALKVLLNLKRVRILAKPVRGRLQ